MPDALMQVLGELGHCFGLPVDRLLELGCSHLLNGYRHSGGTTDPPISLPSCRAPWPPTHDPTIEPRSRRWRAVETPPHLPAK